MKHVITLVTFIFSALIANAQLHKHEHNGKNCGSDELHLNLLKNDKVYSEKFNQNNSLWQNWSKLKNENAGKANTSTENYDVTTLTVVFHDVRNGGTPYLINNNGSYQYIIDYLNLIYNGTNLDGKPSTNNTFIQFCLALQDVNGDSYLGTTTQHITNLTTVDKDNTSHLETIVHNADNFVGNIKFPTSKYINVYVVDDIAGSVAGFATSPSAHGTSLDGIFIERDFLKYDVDIEGKMNVLAHEMGHYLGLFHVFGICDPSIIAQFPQCSCDNFNCLFDGDMVCDTAPSELNLSCNQTTSCGSTLWDDKTNYMDYAPFVCLYNFTNGQIDRMQFMIHPVHGARSSLLATQACQNCAVMDSCEFSINAPSGIINNQVIANTPLTFNQTTSCANNPNLVYSWQIIDINTQTTTVNGTGSSFLVNIAVPGNYKLILTATLQTNPNCFEEAFYQFQVIPEPDFSGPSNYKCGVIPPMASWNKWYRTVPDALTTQNPATNQDIEVINPLNFNDPNFTGVNVPSSVSEILRVGRVIDGVNTLEAGRAYYSNVTFNPTPQNCKFRIYYLGVTGANNTNISAFNDFLNVMPNTNNTTFGFVNLYNLDSEVSGSTNNVSYGLDHLGSIGTGNKYAFTKNDLIFGRVPTTEFPPSYFNTLSNLQYLGMNFKAMNDWSYIDVDFSEFANLNLEVTLTFFSKANNAQGGLLHSYSYFAIECLGGGTPSSIEWNPENIDISCNYPSESSCVNIPIPRPNYIFTQIGVNNANSAWLNNMNNRLASISVERSSDNSNFSPFYNFLISQGSNPPTYNLKLCNDETTGTVSYFRIKYKMLNQEILRTIKVTNQFFYADPPCQQPQIPDTQIYGGIIPTNVPSQYIVCPSNSLNNPLLTLTDPCFPAAPAYKYTWKVGTVYPIGATIPGLNNQASLQITNDMLAEIFNNSQYCSKQIWRVVEFEDPYCGNTTSYESQAFTLYNLVGNGNNLTVLVTDQEEPGNQPCITEPMNFKMNFKLLSCGNLPSDLLNEYIITNNLSANNSITFEFFSLVPSSTTGNYIPFGTPITIDDNFNNFDFNFNFSNEINENNFIFMPLLASQSNNLKVVITYNFYGCTRTFNIFRSVIVAPAAVGGAIALNENCYLNSLFNVPEVPYFTNGGQFLWEYSYTPSDLNSFVTIPNAPTSESLLNIAQYFTNFPVSIRRRANESPVCPGHAYSNIVEVNPSPPLDIVFDNLPTSYCSQTTPPVLPDYSETGIQGTWSPSNIVTQSGTYTFTPLNNQCGDEYVHNITIVKAIMPIFSTIPPTINLCQGAVAPDLPVVSDGVAISGVWSPEVIDTMNSNVYTFTPNSGQCALPYTVNVIITPAQTPIFNIPTHYCQGAGLILLPETSLNNITGTWTPNVINADEINIYEVQFQADNDPCTVLDLVITVLPVVDPVFDLPSIICEGATVPLLPTTSDNDIDGVWTPSTISNTTSGIYTFKPNKYECAYLYEYVLTVQQDCSFYLSWTSQVGCQISNEDTKNFEDVDIVEGPCIRVCENSVITYTITGGVDLISFTEWNITGGTILNSTNTSCQIQWNSNQSSYALQGVIHLIDGSIQHINKCIDKAAAPAVQIGVLPDLQAEYHSLCLNNPVNFQNLTTHNNGNENFYYLWDFGDGTYSTEFEPSHLYTNPGQYTVKLVVTNGCNCSSYDDIIINIEQETIEITCPSVSCEGQIQTYSIDPQLVNECNSLVWSVIGGQIIGQYNGVSSINVLWDHIDEEGFGYVFVEPSGCYNCISSVKIPVVKNIGDIMGEIVVCPRSQHLYRLPQWPTTEFNWSLNANGTDATLNPSNQRNEIFIDTLNAGTIELTCQYYNTLLGCGGNASLTIYVKNALEITGPIKTCTNKLEHFDISIEAGVPPTNLIYTINGPNNFSHSGNTVSFDFAFPQPGNYTIAVTANNYCSVFPFNIEVQPLPISPTVINGNQTICPGKAETYSTAPHSGYTTHWSVEGGSILGATIGNQIVVNFDPLATTPYSVSAWYESTDCASETFTMELNIPTINSAIVSNDITVCGSSYGQYSVNELDSELYEWTIVPPSAGSIESGQNTNSINVLWNHEPQTALVQLNLRKCGIIYNSPDLQVTVTQQPTVTITPEIPTVCKGEAAEFNYTINPTTGFTSSVWDFGDGNSNVVFTPGETVTHTYNDPLLATTTYVVTATFYGINDCYLPTIANTSIVVAPTPIINVTPNTSYSLCSGFDPSEMTYSVILQSGFSETLSVQWYYNNSFVASTTTINASAVGSYYAIVTNAAGCSSITNTYFTYACDSSGPSDPCTPIPPMEYDVSYPDCQTVAITVVDNQGALDINWNFPNAVGSTVVSDSNGLTASNLLPGNYTFNPTLIFNEEDNYCGNLLNINFKIPYKADLKYTINCNNTNNTYAVELLDYSLYYEETPIETFKFTFDGGTTWYNGTLNAENIQSYTAQLPPGTYTIGIFIDNAEYESCIQYKTLILPDFPNADFEIPDSVCLNTPMQFMAPSNTDLNLTYEWNFDNDVINFQQNPVKTFEVPFQAYNITLTVTNKYGCQSSSSKIITVFGSTYNGSLIVTPATTCEGNNLTIEYDPGAFENLPQTYYWYQNDYTATPFATTTNYNNQLVVSESGQYFVYVADENGCLTYTILAKSSNFIPIPEKPIITGTETICKGSNSLINVPENPSVKYIWWLNGVAQPQWNNQASVGMVHNQLGTYVYEVASQVESAPNVYCTSPTASFSVDVIEKPTIPVIGVDLVSCSPYLVNINVTNPEQGITYLWSNGATGTSTSLNHDGPIKVYATSTICEVSAEIDLPLDIFMHTWYYPAGCYSFCSNPNKDFNYIIGPLVELDQWQWQQNFSTIDSGSLQVDPLTDLQDSSYQLYIRNNDCDILLSNCTIEETNCERCEFTFETIDIQQIMMDNVCVYILDLFIENNNAAFELNLSSLETHGYFIQNSLMVLPGGNIYTVLFYPTNSFTGGTSTMFITAHDQGRLCSLEREIELPELCEGVGRVPMDNANTNALAENLFLLAAPNPAANGTTIYFEFSTQTENKKLEIVDLYGRKLWEYNAKDKKGSAQMEGGNLQAGQYFILMKQNNTIIKTTKLIIN